jgi:pimeloyl-ACP methyl ester carboxylesterase
MAAIADDVVRLSRGRMRVVGAGNDGAPVVLLHGWPGFSIDYRDVLPLVARRARAVAPDFFGFGGSGVITGPSDEAADDAAFAGDVIELLDALTLERPVLVGHDVGSAVAAAVARRAPDRLRALVLMNPTHPLIGDKRWAPHGQREAWHQHFHLLPLAEALIDGRRRSVELYLGHFYARRAGSVPIGRKLVGSVVDAYARPGAFAASLAWYRARAAHRDRQHSFAPVGVPTIALWGDRDPMRPLAHREGFEQAFSRSQSRVLAGVGHFVPIEAPEAVAKAVGELL